MQGGSTITQQLAKHVIGDRSRTLTRKSLEAMVAWELERRLGKPEILERYLDAVYFGSGATGIHDAAQTYFDTSPAHLRVSEAALLAGLVAAPSARSPFRDAEAARHARTEVIERMRVAGWVSDAEAQHAHAQPLPRPR